MDSTDGLSPAPSLTSLTDATPTTDNDTPTTDNDTLSDLDQVKLDRGRRQLNGSSKSVSLLEAVGPLLLPITRSPSSPRKAISTGDLSNIQGMLANLFQSTLTTEVSTCNFDQLSLIATILRILLT